MLTGRGAVVDVSNVCCSPELAPRAGTKGCVWERIDTIIDACRVAFGDDAAIVLIADNSLKFYVADRVRRGWSGVRDRYALMEAPVADEEILKIARDRDLCVISGDRFKAYRKLHPWIEQEPERFLHWEVRDGVVQLVPAAITTLPHHEISKLAEAQALRGHRLDPERDSDVFEKRWRCTNPGCLQARLWHEQLLLWPRLDAHGRVVCPSCGEPVDEVGDRALLREIIGFDDHTGEELLRFPLEEGPPVVVGRGQPGHGIDLRVVGSRHEALTSRVSRQHALLHLERDARELARVIAVDLGSRNGSSVRRSRHGRLMDAQPVVAGKALRIRPGDQLVLASAVRLELSGQRFIACPAAHPSATAPTAPPTVASP